MANYHFNGGTLTISMAKRETGILTSAKAIDEQRSTTNFLVRNLDQNLLYFVCHWDSMGFIGGFHGTPDQKYEDLGKSEFSFV